MVSVSSLVRRQTKRTVSVLEPIVTAAFPLASQASTSTGMIGASGAFSLSTVVQADASIMISAKPGRDSRWLCGANGGCIAITAGRRPIVRQPRG